MTEKDLIEALVRVGLEEGDVVFVHSDISIPGSFEGEKDLKDRILTYETCLKKVMVEGTISVPAFFYEYARYQAPFDTRGSKVSDSLGLFSKWIASKPESVRSINPITSIASIGLEKNYISGGETGSALGIDSAFDRLYEVDALMLFIGIDLSAMTFVHYIEHRVGVPHLYNKLYETPVTQCGIPVPYPICSQVRYLSPEIPLDQMGNNEKFKECLSYKEAKLGNGYLRSVRFKSIFNFIKLRLQRDFFYLLKKRPDFIPGEYPLK